MTCIGRGVMAVWNDLEPGRETEFEAWYRRQHIPERLQQPGFREARRYVADTGAPRYSAFYWLDSVAALTTPPYLARLSQPTRWTRRIMPWFRNMARSPCTVTVDHGHGIGGMMIWIAAIGATSPAAAPSARLAPVLAALCDDSAIVRAQLWECDPTARARTSPEERFRSGRDQIADWIVFIEGAAADALSAAAERVRAAVGDIAKPDDLRVSACCRLLWRLLASEAHAPWSDEDAGITLRT